MTGASLSLELANLTDALEKAFLGYKAESSASTADLLVTEVSAGFNGVGFYRKERFKGTITYKCYWFYKVQFSKDSDSTNTKGENVDFQTETVSGDALAVQLSSGGDIIYYCINRKSSESDAVAWLKTKAGIS